MSESKMMVGGQCRERVYEAVLLFVWYTVVFGEIAAAGNRITTWNIHRYIWHSVLESVGKEVNVGRNFRYIRGSLLCGWILGSRLPAAKAIAT